MRTRTTHRSALAVVLAASVCALGLTPAPAQAKHCQRCDDGHTPISGGEVPENTGTAGRVADAAGTWVRKTLGEES